MIISQFLVDLSIQIQLQQLKCPIFELHIWNFVQTKLRVMEFCKTSIKTITTTLQSVCLVKYNPQWNKIEKE